MSEFSSAFPVSFMTRWLPILLRRRHLSYRRPLPWRRGCFTLPRQAGTCFRAETHSFLSLSLFIPFSWAAIAPIFSCVSIWRYMFQPWEAPYTLL